MKLVILTTLAGSAAAFAPSQMSKTSSSLSATSAQTDFFALNAEAAADLSQESSNPSESTNPYRPELELGAQAPLGFFDPFELVSIADQEEFDRLRWIELKHGRVSMLAVVGYLATDYGLRFPGAEDIPSGFAALDNLPGMVWAQMFATWGMMEAANQDQYKAPWGMNQNSLDESPAEFKGDFRNGVFDFGWDKFSPEMKMRKRAIELNNGRAAQMGILGLMVHDKLGNLDAILPGHIAQTASSAVEAVAAVDVVV